MRNLVSPVLSALTLVVLFCACPSSAAAGEDIEATFKPDRVAPDGATSLQITVKLPAGHHAYAPDSSKDGGVPTSIESTSTSGLTEAGPLTFTEPREKWDDLFETTVRIHEGKFVLVQPFTVDPEATGTVSVSGSIRMQVCDEASCLLEEIPFGAELQVEVPAVEPPPAIETADEAEIPDAAFGLLDSNVSQEVSTSTDGVRGGESFNLLITMTVKAGRYLYAPDSPAGLPTELTLEEMEGIRPLGPLQFPEPEKHFSEDFEDDVHTFDGTVVFTQPLVVDTTQQPGTLNIRGVISGQTCDDRGCITFDLPIMASITVEAGEARSQAAPSDNDTAPATTTSSTPEKPSRSTTEGVHEMPLSAFLLLAVFWGLITLLMPCTYPMIPITISFFTKQAIQRNGRVLPLSLAYGAGIVLIFILIGVVFGSPIIHFATHPITNLIIGILFLFFALVLFGAVDLQPPRFLSNMAGKASSKGGLIGVFLMGATLVITSFTCTAPFVGSLLSVGAGEGNVQRIVLGMGVFGLTMALPFVFLSLVPGRMQKMPQAGEWMHVLKVFLGFVEVAAALKFFSNADLVWGWGILSREVFLVLWMGIFLAGAMYLFGWIHLKGDSEHEIGPVRMVSGLASFLFSLYLGLGVMGYVMDDITTAIIPNYSNERLSGQGPGAAKKDTHVIIKDDYARATETAVDEDKLLLINFTGFS